MCTVSGSIPSIIERFPGNLLTVTTRQQSGKTATITFDTIAVGTAGVQSGMIGSSILKKFDAQELTCVMIVFAGAWYSCLRRPESRIVSFLRRLCR